jgi:IS5 family transposase
LNIQLGALPHDALPAAVRAHPCVPCRRDRSSKRQDLASAILDRCITDAGYRGHNAPPHHKFKVYTSGQKRRVTPQIKREFKRTSRNTTAWTAIYVAHASGDAINDVLAAAGYNFRRLLAWLRLLLLRILIALSTRPA